MNSQKTYKLMLLGGLSYLIPVIEEAHKLGVYVITADYIPENIAHKYSDEYINVSIIDKEAVLKVATKKNIDGILSFAVDPGVVTAAYVAEKMGLHFQCSYKSACILQNKALFRSFLLNNGFNAPKSKGYNNFNDALQDIDSFCFPVIVKPVDSAGSKGVTKVTEHKMLKEAIDIALCSSLSKEFIIEEFLDVVGYQSSADVFAVDGNLVYSVFSDQLFDENADNPYTPAIEIWPSSMNIKYQNNLSKDIQRLFTLLDVKTGIFNVECRVCSDGKCYIMEVSPRGGGNRIAEIQQMATNQQLIANEVKSALGLPVECLENTKHDGVWCNYILHSYNKGKFDSLSIDTQIVSNNLKYNGCSLKQGDAVNSFSGANMSIGNLFLRFDNRDDCNNFIKESQSLIKIILK